MRVFNDMSITGLVKILAPAALCLAPLAASAQTSVTLTGQVSTGTDPLGGAYYVGPTGGGLVQFQEIAGVQPDPTNQVLFTPPAGLIDYATAFTLSITGSSDGILPLDFGYGNYFETFTADGYILSSWAASVSADGKSITYTAAPGEELLAGERFATNTTFSTFNDLPSDFAYTITWTGDVAAAGVPEASTWAMLLIGFGGVGFAARRGQRAAKGARFA